MQNVLLVAVVSATWDMSGQLPRFVPSFPDWDCRRSAPWSAVREALLAGQGAEVPVRRNLDELGFDDDG